MSLKLMKAINVYYANLMKLTVSETWLNRKIIHDRRRLSKNEFVAGPFK